MKRYLVMHSTYRTISGLILSQELACLPQVETGDSSVPDAASGAAAASLDAASESESGEPLGKASACRGRA